ncbi:MAG: hypothetical protein ABI743_05690 [bacterium]
MDFATRGRQVGTVLIVVAISFVLSVFFFPVTDSPAEARPHTMAASTGTKAVLVEKSPGFDDSLAIAVHPAGDGKLNAHWHNVAGESWEMVATAAEIHELLVQQGVQAATTVTGDTPCPDLALTHNDEGYALAGTTADGLSFAIQGSFEETREALEAANIHLAQFAATKTIVPSEPPSAAVTVETPIPPAATAEATMPAEAVPAAEPPGP